VTFNPAIKTLADIPRHYSATRPDSIATLFEERSTTYRTLDLQSSRVANGLIASGVRPGSRVAVLDQNSDQYFDVLFGVAKARAVLVAVNWRLAPAEITFIVNDAKAEILFVGEAYLGLVREIEGNLPLLRHVIVLGNSDGQWPSYSQWLGSQSDLDPRLPASPEETVLQMYTSGTTGHPKGVELSHAVFYANDRTRAQFPDADPLQTWSDWSQDEVSLVAMPGFHVSGTGWAVFGYYNGARNVVLAQFDPGRVLRAIAEQRVTKLVLVPATIQMLLNHPDCARTDFSSIKYLLYGASPIPLDLLREAIAAFRCGFVQVYGMTETTGAVTYLPADDHTLEGNQRMRSAGKAMTGIKLEIRDTGGRALGPGETGEIWIHSPTRMNGYWNRPEATAETITPDGWVRSGDAGFLDRDGFLYIQDRVKDMIVSGGENIYPAEVESAIYGHPAVAEVAVIAIPDARWGEAAKAIVVLKPGAEASADSILAFARDRIASYKLPKSVDFVDSLPRNASGKILKRELRKPYWEGRERQVN
jgi:acyl-CoA synthetase (AMP-forming)/AMP-acid ligase II